jgi:hypothetical protein
MGSIPPTEADDAGTVAEDAGSASEDTGTVSEDVGSIAVEDSGTTAEDAGTTAEDAGVGSGPVELSSPQATRAKAAAKGSKYLMFIRNLFFLKVILF